MANNKKVYQIEINGLEQSVKSVGVLIERLGELQNTLKDLSKMKIDIPIDVKADLNDVVSKLKNVGKTQTIDVDISNDSEHIKLLNQRREAIEAVNREIGNTGKNLQEYRKETKELVAEETKARNEARGYANTLDGLKQELKDLNSTKGKIDLGSEKFVEVSKRIYEVNAKLKALEATQNVFSRNVGNYTNSIREAAKESENEAKSIQSLEEALEQMNKMKLTVDVGGVERQFNSLKEATRTLNNEAKALGLQLEQLKKSGGEGTPEYQKLEQQFNATAQAADDLEHSVANVNQSISEIKDDSGSLGKLTNAFEAFNDVAQVGIGISGLFGQSQEEIQKAMNRTIQLTTALNGVRKLLDKTTQSGIIINKMYEATLKALGTSASAASVGVKLLAGALTTIGVGALVIAIGTLIDGISKMVDHFKNAKTQADRFRDSLNDLKTSTDQYLDSQKRLTENKYKIGLISEIDKLKANLINAQTVANTFQLKILGMIKTLKELNGMTQYEYGIIKDVDVTNIESVRKALVALTPAYDALIIKQQQITEGRLGDVKALTVQEQALISFYDTLQEIINSQATINDYYKNQSKERAKKLQEIDKKIEKNTIDAMKDGWKKQLAQLKYEHDQEIKEAEASAKELRLTEEKKQQLLDSIHAKHTKFRMDAEKQHYEDLKNLNEDYANQLVSSYSSMMSKLSTYLNLNETIFSNDALNYERLVDDTISPLERLQRVTVKTFKDIGNAIKQEYKNWFTDIDISDNIQKNFEKTTDLIGKYIDKESEAAEQYRESLNLETSVQQTDETITLANALKQRLDIQKDYYKNAEGAEKEYYDNAVKMQESLLQAITGLTKAKQEEGKKTYEAVAEELQETLLKIRKIGTDGLSDDYLKTLKSAQDFFDEISLIDDNAKQRAILNEQQYLERINEIRKNASQLTIQSYEKQYDEIEKMREKYNQRVNTTIQPLDDVGQWVLKNAEINKFSKAYETLNKQINDEVNKNNEAIKNLENELTLINSINDKYAKKEQLTEDEIDLLRTYGFKLDDIDKKYAEINEKKGTLVQAEGIVEEYENALDLLKKQFENNEISLVDYEAQKSSMTTLYDEAKKMVQQLQDELNGMDLNGLSDEVIKALDVKAKKIKIEIFDLKSVNSQLGDIAANIKKWQDSSLKSWKDWSKNIAQLLNDSVQIIGNIINNLAEATYNKTVSMIDAQLEQLDDYMNELDRKLDKQAEIIEKYNDRINDSEDELRDARGSRRQFLIDTLAAQQQAYLEEYAVQQKLEKEKEEAEKRREKLEKEKEKAEKRRNKAQQKVQIAQALANTAVAVTNALAVQPWFLGLALSAVAAAMGAAQVKAISSVKYADGGLLKGRSHREGGIPVGNTGIEVEGQEFIVNKQSTAKNLPLLEYINDNRRTLTAEDVVKLLKSNNTPIAKTSSTARKYADGGKLPTLQTEAIQRTVEVRDSEANSRNYVVQVVDIVNKMDNLNSVRTLSGLNNV